LSPPATRTSGRNSKPEAAAQALQTVVVQVGAYQAEESAELKSSGGVDAVCFVLRFESGTAKLRVVLDSQGKLSGSGSTAST